MPPAVPASPAPAPYLELDPRTLLHSKNPRRQPVPAARISDIAASMKKHGVLEPLIIRPSDKATHGYQVVAGDTRMKAAIEAGLAKVPCVVRDINDLDMLELQLIENVQRNDMHPLDEGEAFRQLIAGKKHTPESLAAAVGMSIRWIYQRLEFTKLIEPIREAFLKGEITVSHADLIARLEAIDQERLVAGGRHGEGLFVEDRTLDGELRISPISVRDLNRWIEHNVRLAIATDAVQHLLPEVEEIVDETGPAHDARLLQVATVALLPQDPKLKVRFKGVLTEYHWKRAGGKHTCDKKERAVIVFGRGQGETLDVCVDKTCGKHFPDHTPAAKERRAKQRERQTGAGKPDAYHVQQQREEQERTRRAARWNRLHPALATALRAAAKGLPKISGAVFSATLKAHRLPPTTTVATLARVLVTTAVESDIDRSKWGYHDEPKLVAWAKLLGVNVKAIAAQLEPKNAAPPKPADKPARATRAKAVRRAIRRVHAKAAKGLKRKAGKKR